MLKYLMQFRTFGKMMTFFVGVLLAHYSKFSKVGTAISESLKEST